MLCPDANILRDDRIESKLTLQPPPSDDLNLFGFAFADGGEICVLQGLVKHFVYMKQEYVSTFSFVLRVADIRDHDLLWSVQPRIQRSTTEDPDLLLLCDLGERNLSQESCEPFLKGDASLAQPEDGLFWSMYQEVFARYRDDGKIWVVGAYSGKIQLLSGSGRVLDEAQLETEAAPVDEAHQKQQILDAMGSTVAGPPPDTSIRVPSRHMIVESIATIDDGLLILPTEQSKNHNTLIMFDSANSRFYHFLLPKKLENALMIATTPDAVWFDNPVSWIGVDELMELARNANATSDSGNTAPSGDG
jgi:hypothetical protein